MIDDFENLFADLEDTQKINVDTFNIDEAIETAVKYNDMTKVQQDFKSGGGGYVPPAKGSCLLRFAGYIEVGKHKNSYEADKTDNKVHLIFELHGPKYPPKEYNGKLEPQRITMKENLTLGDKSNLKKIFNLMRGDDNTVKHIAQMLGRAFKGEIVHSEFTGHNGEKIVTAKLKGPNGYTLAQPITEDPETGEVKRLKVPEMLGSKKLFLWDAPSRAMWDSLFIAGKFNTIQDTIKTAVNFKGSPIDRILNGGGVYEDAKAEVNTVKPAPSADSAQHDSRWSRRK